MVKKKTWREKLHDAKDFPRVEVITESMQQRWGTGTVVIPKPIEVDELMKLVPKGKLTTIHEIRKVLAKRHNATIGCPITIGIFARIASEVAMEEITEDKRKVTAFWRTLRTNGEINPKYPGGIEFQKERLESEGHQIIQKGKRFLVVDFKKSLVNLS
jgi:alkylated DNA nucleotide flippase Atl1